MKKSLFILAAILTIGFTSCSKDDAVAEPTQVVDNAKHTWTLTITTTTSVPGMPDEVETSTQDVVDQTAAEVDVMIKSMSTTTTVGGITIKTTVTKAIKA